MASLLTSICDVPGIRVGHAQNDAAMTGCTVILPETGAVAGVDVRGSAPGTREIEAIKLVRLVARIHAVLFSGGSAFGLDAAGGVQQYLEEKGIGFDVGVAHVPVVPSAVIFDLHVGDASVRPDKKMGLQAAKAASRETKCTGRIGVGCGATVGKILGMQQCMKGGVGSACRQVGECRVGALVVVNAFGDIVDDGTDHIVAGARHPQSGKFLDTGEYIQELRKIDPPVALSNTTLAVVATDAGFKKEEITKIAQMAQDGLARVIRPAHTPFDGDLVIGLSVGDKQENCLAVGMAAAGVVADAILSAVKAANP